MNKPLKLTCVLFAMVCGCAPKNTEPAVLAPDTTIDTAPASANDPLATRETVTEITSSVGPEKSGVGPENTTAFVITAATRSIWDGVYTEQQRQRGQASFTTLCVRCHGDDLEGGDAVPSLVGEDFLQRWKRKRAGNLFSYMKEEMPPKKRRTAPEYADILAFLLSKHNAPAGDQELAHSFIELQSIRMDKHE